jgi:hypothetical protein
VNQCFVKICRKAFLSGSFKSSKFEDNRPVVRLRLHVQQEDFFFLTEPGHLTCVLSVSSCLQKLHNFLNVGSVVLIILNKHPSNYVFIHVINKGFITGDNFVFADLGFHC